MTNITPIPDNEIERVIALSDFDLDYSDLQNNFKDLTKLAAYVAGTDVSLVNLIDSFTQWTVGNFGFDLDQMEREDSVCQYTIVEKNHFEVKDLSTDERFKNKEYVSGYPNFKYYFGVPLVTEKGHSLGALCVLDKVGKEISPEKIELLKGIADEIVNRIVAIKVIDSLRNKVSEAKVTHVKVAHDIRGPLGGIISLAQFISEQGDNNKLEEVLEFVTLIHKSGSSVLELAEEILSSEKQPHLKGSELPTNELNLLLFKDKLEKLYGPQAQNKSIRFEVHTNAKTDAVPFSKNKLLQITGNLISNGIKFTPVKGSVLVTLDLKLGENENILQIRVTDSGIGLSEVEIGGILLGAGESTSGTDKEKGFGFGLPLVKHLIEGLKGTFDIESMPGKGTVFTVLLPQKKQ